MSNGDWFQIASHSIAALLGGGAAKLLDVLLSLKERRNRRLLTLLDQVREERDMYLEQYEGLGVENERQRQEILRCRAGVVRLVNQCIERGVEPNYRPDWLSGHGLVLHIGDNQDDDIE